MGSGWRQMAEMGWFWKGVSCIFCSGSAPLAAFRLSGNLDSSGATSPAAMKGLAAGTNPYP